ncbi:choice-of-anchor P family protein [Amycolatopsis aidingensis]|uniref:choice-of-anchor P family protein n=1 Tax=Amycolatopsis aidingensis TaxID=2842453 RepID=UPI001E46F92C|nr:choice-of-anchor P family protein [Amycolatopsis aidingensis]
MSSNKAALRGAGLLAALLTSGLAFVPAAGATGAGDSAFALSATGLLKVDPIPAVTSENGFQQDSVAEFGSPGKIVRARVLNAQAGPGKAKASVAELEADLGGVPGLGLGSPLLSATAVQASCHAGKASSSLAEARLGDTKLDVSAPPNTAVQVPGVASVVLNKQVTKGDGTVTVTAISIKIDRVQAIEVASATCAPGEGDGGQPASPEPAPEPTDPAGPPAGSGNDDPADTDEGDGASGTDDDGGNGAGGPGTQADANGMAPRPTPVPAHLDVTG